VPRLAAVAAAFGRDLDHALERVATLVAHARRDGVDLLVLPDAALGGYLPALEPGPGPRPEGCAGVGPPAEPEDGSSAPLRESDLPPALPDGHPALRRVAELAGDMTVCVGYREQAGPTCYNTAICVTGDGVLGRHRKVHQPPGEARAYAAGDGFAAFDTPVGRLGMLIDYDKTFPEAARTLALDGAQVLACLSAWPTSVTNRAPRTSQDRQSRLFDLYDRARAAENQVVLVSSNQTGVLGGMRFLGQAKVVGPGGDVLARTWAKAGIAAADVDLDAELGTARRVLHHLKERRPDAY
jgi:predicted amidohydrolase